MKTSRRLTRSSALQEAAAVCCALAFTLQGWAGDAVQMDKPLAWAGVAVTEIPARLAAQSATASDPSAETAFLERVRETVAWRPTLGPSLMTALKGESGERLARAMVASGEAAPEIRLAVVRAAVRAQPKSAQNLLQTAYGAWPAEWRAVSQVALDTPGVAPRDVWGSIGRAWPEFQDTVGQIVGRQGAEGWTSNQVLGEIAQASTTSGGRGPTFGLPGLPGRNYVLPPPPSYSAP